MAMNKKFLLGMFSIIAMTLLSAVAFAVVATGVWENGFTSTTITKGSSTYFDVAVFSMNPPAEYSIFIYDASGALISTLRSNIASDGWYTERVPVTPADYGNIGGTFMVVVNTMDAIGDRDYQILNLAVTQAAPVVSDIPDMQMETDQTFTFDLDNYVTDADDATSALSWTVSGNTNIAVSIDTVTHVATFTVAGGWTGAAWCTPRGCSSRPPIRRR